MSADIRQTGIQKEKKKSLKASGTTLNCLYSKTTQASTLDSLCDSEVQMKGA